MLTKHSFTYFLGRGLPGLINFLALSVYTRLIMPAEYGTYSLVVTTVNLFNAVLFQWLRLVLLRFTPKATDEVSRAQLNTTLLLGYVVSLGLSGLALGAYLLLSNDAIRSEYVWLGAALLVTQALFEIGLDYYRSHLDARRYSLAHFLKATAAIALGTVLACAGFGAPGLLWGLLLATTVAVGLYFRQFLRELASAVRSFDRRDLRTHLNYGVPLTASSALTFVMDSSGRYLTERYLGVAVTGAYAVGFDLAKQTLWVVMISVSLASYPLVVRALEEGGPALANRHLKNNLLLLLAVAAPLSIGMAALSDELAHYVVGAQYADTVARIVPYIAIGALLSGLKSYYVDQSFQLSQRTALQLGSVGAAAVINVVVNVALLPTIGVMGAAYANLLSYAAVLLISYLMSRRAYRLPVPWPELSRIMLAAGLMGAFLWFAKPYASSWWRLALLTTLAGTLYGSLLLAFRIIPADVLRTKLNMNRFRKQYA